MEKIIGVIILVGVIGVLASRPKAIAPPNDAYFEAMALSLKAHGEGRPQIVIDLDRLDHNIKLVRERLSPPLSYRVVTKSLPSLDLIKYIMKQAQTNKLMEFHAPFVATMLEELGGEKLDILMGKPVPVEAADAAFRIIKNSKTRELFFSQVQWLIDSEARLSEFQAFHKRAGVKAPLLVSVEIDVGLRRGGVRSVDELERLLRAIEKSRGTTRFSGFMGYDGHVGHVPTLFGSKESAMRSEFAKTQALYSEFVEAAKQRVPELFADPLTFNGGGSRTYAFFTKDSPVNDVALGSALLQPQDFDGPPAHDHQAALFVATPVIKRLDPPLVPFLPEWAAKLWAIWNPNRALSFYVYGGNWAKESEFPKGLSVNPLYASFPNRNLLPNQELLNGSRAQDLKTGDYVFFRPGQSDILFEFDRIALVRAGKVVGIWKAFSQRF